MDNPKYVYVTHQKIYPGGMSRNIKTFNWEEGQLSERVP